MGWLFGRKKDKAAAPAAPAPTKAAPPPAPAPDAADWVSIQGVGNYQGVLAGKVPRRVAVELFPWEREQRVTARLDGKRVGELPYGPEAKVYPYLAARRAAGMPPFTTAGEVRRGDYVPVYLAVHMQDGGTAAEWLASIAPPGWTPPRKAEVGARLHKMGKYQDALAQLYAKYGGRTRGVEVALAFQSAPSGKYAGQTMGLVSLDGIVFAEMNAPAEGLWDDVLADYEAGTPGRTLVNFTRTDGGKYGAYGVYKAPKVE